MDVDGSGVVDACVRLQTISNSLVHDNVSAVSATIIDFDRPEMAHTYMFKRLKIASSMTIYAPSQLRSYVSFVLQ